MNVKKDLILRIRGWFPQEPFQTKDRIINSKPQTKTESNKMGFKVAQIANAIIIIVFLATNFLFVQPFYRNIEVSILQWSIFIIVLIVANILIYLHYKKRSNWRVLHL